MKAPLKARRLAPEEVVAIAASTAPQQPPAQVAVNEGLDISTTLNLRLRRSTVEALHAAAKVKNMTMKQILCHALQGAGVSVAPPDLEDRTPRRTR